MRGCGFLKQNFIMKIQNYRIGNLLDYNGEVVKITTLGIDCNNNETIIATNKSFLWHVSKLDGIKPIQLTKEWLLKFNWNGYNPLHFNSNFKIDKQGRLYCNGDYKGVNINYVHQLQNLYFDLSGKELTYENEL